MEAVSRSSPWKSNPFFFLSRSSKQMEVKRKNPWVIRPPWPHQVWPLMLACFLTRITKPKLWRKVIPKAIYVVRLRIFHSPLEPRSILFHHAFNLLFRFWVILTLLRLRFIYMHLSVQNLKIKRNDSLTLSIFQLLSQKFE